MQNFDAMGIFPPQAGHRAFLPTLTVSLSTALPISAVIHASLSPGISLLLSSHTLHDLSILGLVSLIALASVHLCPAVSTIVQKFA